MNTHEHQPVPCPTETANLRVWLVHDWLVGWRGGEKLLLELVRMFPLARIATLVHATGTTHDEIDRRVERVSFLQRLPGAQRHYRNYLPLFPRAVRSLKLDGPCDLVISVSHAVAKGVRVPRGAAAAGRQVPHICYCNTPMRYIWGLEEQYADKWSLKGLALGIVKPHLRRFDRRTTEVTAFIGNSQTVAQRIRRIYARDAAVVYPGVDEQFYVCASEIPGIAIPGHATTKDFYLVVSALVPYKRIDLAVEAFRAMPQKPLVIIGKGPEERRLKALAAGAPNIEFLGWQSDDVARAHYQRCAAFIFPGEEDFGMTPVEAQMCGAPVIAYRAGGATETVIDGLTGIFFDQQTAPALRRAVEQFAPLRPTLRPQAARKNALRFTWEQFRSGIRDVVGTVMRQQ